MSEIDDDELLAEGWKPRALDGFIGIAGPLWTRKEPAGWAYAIRAESKHLNPARVVHGGMLVTLIDHALSTIAWEASERDDCVTIQLDTQFIAPVRSGTVVQARGTVTRRTSGLVFMQGSLTVEDRQVLTAQAIMRVLKK